MRKLFVFMVAAALVMGCVLPAMAADKEVSFYGNVRMNTFWIDRDKNTGNLLVAPGGAYDRASLYDETDVWWDICQGCSRFGARFKAGDVSANVEIRPFNGSYYRQWWGAWNFGPGSLLVGQTWSPTFHGISNSVFDGGDGAAYGECGGSLRVPMVQLSFPFEIGTLKVAFERNGTSVAGITAVDPNYSDSEAYLPKVEFSFDGKAGPVGFGVFGGYNWLDARDVTTDSTVGINGYYLGAMVSVPIGPAYFKGSAYMGQNPAEYGLFIPGQPYTASMTAGTTDVQDVDIFGFMVLAGMKFTDMLAVEAGYGYAKSERDTPGASTLEDPKAFYYIQMPITLAKGVTVTPEIGKFDEKDHTLADGTTVDDGDAMYYGAYWKIDF